MWVTLDRIAWAQIHHNISDVNRTITTKCTTARQAWVSLIANFVQASVTSRMAILAAIHDYTFQPDSSVMTHTNRLRLLGDQLMESGGSMPEDQLVMHLLTSMPEEYEHTVLFLRMMPPATLTLDYVSNALLAAETMLATKKHKAISTARSYITHTEKGRGAVGRSTSKPSGGHRVKHSGDVCSFCHKSGHARESCFQDPKIGYPDWWGSRPRLGDKPKDNKRQRGESSGTNRLSPSAAGSNNDESDEEAPRQKSQKTNRREAISFHTVVELCEQQNSDDAKAFLSEVIPSPTNERAALRLSSSSDWVLDSGTTAHICSDRSILVDVSETRAVRVCMGSATTVANAIGTAILWLSKDGTNFDQRVTLRDVLFVPDFSVNLISIRKLARAGYGFVVKGNTARLTMADMTPFAIALGTDRDDLYVITARVSMSCSATDVSKAGADNYHAAETSAAGDSTTVLSAVSSVDDRATGPASTRTTQELRDVTPLHLMHDRLNHLNVQQMVQMRASDMVDGAQSLPSSIPQHNSATPFTCESCIIGKSRRSTMPRKVSTQRVARCLQLVHSDICGPVRHPSIVDEARYLATFVDHFSRYAVVFTMKTKDEVLDHFKTYKSWAERVTGQKVVTLRTDGGGEYTSKAFNAYLRQEGIQRQITPPHTPEHNGVAERLNLIIFGAVRCMLHRARLPPSFWAEAAHNAVHVRNRCPTRAVKGKTPYEMWTGNKPSIDHLRVFGCLAYVHVDEAAKRTGKVEGRSYPCVFVGYSSEAKAWRLYNPIAKHSKTRWLTSRDVTFVEDRLVDIDGVLASVHLGEGEEGEDVFPDVDDSLSPSPAATSEVSLGLDGLPTLVPPPATVSSELDIFNLDVGDNSDADVYEDDEDGYGFLDTVPVRWLFPRELESKDRAAQVLYTTQPAMEQHEEQQCWALSTTVLDTDEPSSYAEAMARPDAVLWRAAVQSEYDSLQRTGTYTLTQLPDGRHAIGCKWVFKIKRHADGSVDRYKARLVAKGFSQKAGLDYKETFAPVAKFASIRTLLALAAHQDYEVHQMDVKTAFLNGDLDVELYMQQPEGFITAGQEKLVCHLRKSLYGLKQAGRAWFEKINTALIDMDFTPLDSDHCVYVRHQGGEVLYIVLYVDDLLLIGSSLTEINKLKVDLSNRFEMTDLGEAQYVLGLQLSRDRTARALSLSQSDYIRRLLERYGMSDCKPAPTPLAVNVRLSKDDCPTVIPIQPVLVDGKHTYASVVGSIMYAMLGTRPDLAYTIGQLTRFNGNPGAQHVIALKRVLRYLRGSIDFKLVYGTTSSGSSGSTTSKLDVFGYCDSDWGASIDDRRSVSGTLFMIAGGAVTWQAQRQKSVALSSVEAEYVAACQASKDAIWLRAFLTGLGLESKAPTIILCDSQGAIALAKNPEHHQRSKHIDMRYHFVREQVAAGAIVLVYTATSNMAADQLTKPLSRELHNRCMRSMGLQW
jgi:transposase InsO family protein